MNHNVHQEKGIRYERYLSTLCLTLQLLFEIYFKVDEELRNASWLDNSTSPASRSIRNCSVVLIV